MNIQEAKEVLNRVNNAKRFDGIYTSVGIIFEAISVVLAELDKKDKEIKEKIEWLRKISDNGLNAVRFAATHDDEIERMQKQKDISTMIGILQELLGESD